MADQAHLFGPTFRCISADPPWEERGGGKCKRGADRHYPLMSVPEIYDTMTGSPLWRPAPSAHLWMWVTDNFLQDGLALMDALGFRFIRTMVWVKAKHPRRADPVRKRWGRRRGLVVFPKVKLQVGLGQYLRGSHELCLLGVRGDAMVPAPADRALSVLIAPRGRHSAKPDEAFERFERVSPGPRVEFFARVPRPGWDAFGNDPSLEEAAS